MRSYLLNNGYHAENIRFSDQLHIRLNHDILPGAEHKIKHTVILQLSEQWSSRVMYQCHKQNDEKVHRKNNSINLAILQISPSQLDKDAQAQKLYNSTGQ